VLFTDITASTAMRSRLGEDAFDEVRAAHDGLSRETVAAHGGTIVKHTGDGVMAVFVGASDALACAARLQRTMARHARMSGDGLTIRAGLSIGDAIVDDGDLQGLAVVEARRLCDAAQPNEVLCSDLARVAAGSRGGHRFGPVTARSLKGLPAPLPSCALLWDDTATSTIAPGAPRVTVFGTVALTRDGNDVQLGGPKERAVLATLVAAEGAPVSVDALVDAVWADDPPRSATRTLHSYIARLRRALGPGGGDDGWLATAGRAYRLAVDRAQVDAWRFADLATSGRVLLESGDLGAAVSAFDDALSCWRGVPYDGLDDNERCATAARALVELRSVVIEDRFDALLALGQASDLVPALEAAVAAEPLRERLWGQLMLALYRAGRQAEALRAYQRARGVLADELGIEPGHALRELEGAILEQDDARLRAGAGRDRPVVAVPVALDVATSALFGRDDEARHLEAVWEGSCRGEGSLVSVVGPEGIGKTRLVAQLAVRAHADGAVIGYGRCDDAHRSARSVFDQLLRSAGSSLMRAQAGALPGDTLGTSIGSCLAAWAADVPVLVVLDDLHDAAGEVLEVLSEVVAAIANACVLLVAIFRSEAGDARRTWSDQHVALAGIDRGAVGSICALYGDDWTRDEVDRLYRETHGIPLAVHEEASALVRSAASRRVQEAAEQATLAGFRLSTSEQAVSDEVRGIQRVVDQRRRQLATRGVDTDVAACPYRGLLRFEAEDAAWFFGRDKLVADLAAHLVTRSVIALVGASGSGKSSVLRAGLLPALAAGVLPGSAAWRVVLTQPGATPNADLCRLLDDDVIDLDAPTSAMTERGRRVVVVDQLEELFTACDDAGERDAFASTLRDVVRAGGVAILAIRADQLTFVGDVPVLAELFGGNDVLVGAIPERELRDVIVGPAERAGLRLEDGLVDEVIADARNSSGVLPLMQTALLETWARRSGDELTIDGYRASGGVHGAVARLAESAYARMTPAVQDCARRMLLRLADASDDGALDLRRRVRIEDVVVPHDSDAAVAYEELLRNRLLTVSDGTVEVAHEALLREWPRLRDWLADDVAGRRLHQRLGDAAHAWAADGRDDAELLRGSRLNAALEWSAQHDADLNVVEREFLDASRAAAERELVLAHRRADREARTSRRLRRLLVGVALSLVIALVAGTVAFRQRDRANASREVARAAQRSADAGRLSARALVDKRIDRALLTAVAAVQLDDTTETRAGLVDTLQRAPDILAMRRFGNHRPNSLVANRDASRLAVMDDAGNVYVVDGQTLRGITTMHDGATWALAFMPDGRLAYGSIGSTEAGEDSGPGVKVVDLDRERAGTNAVTTYTGVDFDAQVLAVDPSARRIAVAAANGRGQGDVVVWDADQPSTPRLHFTREVLGNMGLAFDAGAEHLFVGTVRGIEIVDVATGSVTRTLQGSELLATNADATLLATTVRGSASTGQDTTVAVYDVATGRRVRSFETSEGAAAFAFARDGSLLVGTARGSEWWGADGVRRARLVGQSDMARGVAVGPSGTHGWTGSLDGTLVRWDLAGRAAVIHRTDGRAAAFPPQFVRRDIRVSRDGDVAYLFMYVRDVTDGKFVMRDVDDGMRARMYETGQWDIYSVDVAPDRRTMVTASGDATVALLDRRTGKVVGRWRSEVLRTVADARFSPDGSLVAAALVNDPEVDGDRTDLFLLDTKTLDVRRRIDLADLERGGVPYVRWAPDGRTLYVLTCCASPGSKQYISAYDAQNGTRRWRANAPGSASFDLSHDGRLLAFGGYDGTLSLVSTDDGRVVRGPVPAHSGYTIHVSFSPDDAVLFSSGTDDIGRLWDVRDLTPAGTFDAGDGAGPGAWSGAFTRDGSLTLASDMRTYAVDVDARHLIDRVCDIVGRDLTESEWRELFATRPFEQTCP
jgi:DNA-binding SARP family transcriptional activator/WD40 repeat protein